MKIIYLNRIHTARTQSWSLTINQKKRDKIISLKYNQTECKKQTM